MTDDRVFVRKVNNRIMLWLLAAIGATIVLAILTT